MIFAFSNLGIPGVLKNGKENGLITRLFGAKHYEMNVDQQLQMMGSSA